MTTPARFAPVHQPGPIQRACNARRAAEAATSAADGTSARITAARTELDRLLALHRHLAGQQPDDVLRTERLHAQLAHAAAVIDCFAEPDQPQEGGEQ